ncbi:MAG: plasmid stability protein [Verrucomicrobiales bacterium]|jgi:plasmid stability protein
MSSLIYWNPFEYVDKREVKCFLFAMATLVIKTFPEELHEKLKNVAAEHRRSITKEAICLLEKALSNQEQEGVKSYWANRKLLPEFEKSIQAGAFGSGTDSTNLISEEREER